MNSQLKVYITKSKAASITHMLRIDSTDDDLRSVYKDDLSGILSKPELALLHRTKLFYEDADLDSSKYVKTGPVDTRRYAYEGGIPTYHASPSCERLHSNFKNLEIPPELQDRIDEFRAFCKENRSLYNDDEDRFFTRLGAVFNLRNPPKKVDYANSGTQEMLNLDIDEIERSIDQLLISSECFRNRDEETYKIIRKLGFGSHKAKRREPEDSPIHRWDAYKADLKSMLREYYRVKLNPDLEFSGPLLDGLGFKPCNECFKKPSF